MSNLYEIRENIAWLQEQAEMRNLEEDEELEERLTQLDIDRDETIEEYVKIIKNLESDAEQFKLAAQEFQKKKQRAESNAKYLRDQITYDLINSGGHKKRVGHFTVGLSRTSGKVVVVDEALVDDKFKKVKVEVSKTAVKDYVNEEGEIPEGIKLENGVRLSIR